jgi:hypothetical protein
MSDRCPCPSCGRDMLRVDALRDGEVVESLLQCPDDHLWLERRDTSGQRVVIPVS